MVGSFCSLFSGIHTWFSYGGQNRQDLPVLNVFSWLHVSSQTDKICEESLSSIMHVFSLPSSVFFQVFFYLKIYYYIFNINTLKLLKNIKHEI
jgi:hypothetical protein